MPDYYATLKIQQGRLKAAMTALGLRTIADLARRCGASQSELGKLLNFKASPRTKSGAWRSTVVRVCATLGTEPSDIFPDHLQHEIPSNKIAKFVEHAQLTSGRPQQLGPGDACEQAECSAVIDEVLSTLTEREQYVLRARIWEGATCSDIGRTLGLTGGSVGLIEAKALRKLRHPSRADVLAEVFEGKSQIDA